MLEALIRRRVTLLYAGVLVKPGEHVQLAVVRELFCELGVDMTTRR